MAIYDTMQHKSDVVTICVGLAASLAIPSGSWNQRKTGWRCPTADYDSPAFMWTSNRY